MCSTWLGYRVYAKSMMTCAVSFEYRSVTDGQTDGRTDLPYQYRASALVNVIVVTALLLMTSNLHC